MVVENATGVDEYISPMSADTIVIDMIVDSPPNNIDANLNLFELIQTQMAQKPVLRIKECVRRALRASQMRKEIFALYGPLCLSGWVGVFSEDATMIPVINYGVFFLLCTPSHRTCGTKNMETGYLKGGDMEGLKR